MPNRIIGSNTESIKYYGSPDSLDMFTSKGTLKQWRENVAELCIGRNGLELGLYCGFAGILMHWHNEGGSICQVGDSGTGKTKTAGRISMSVAGNPSQRMNDAANPKGGFEGLCYDANHATLFIDELTNAKLDHLKAIPYMGINGCAPTRGYGNMHTTGRGYVKGRKWRTFIHLTSEHDYSKCLAQFGAHANVGEELRLICISGLDYAINDEHFNSLSENCLKYYGTAAPALIEYIIEHSPDINKMINDEYVKLISHSEKHTHQTKRVAKLFALLITGGVLAIMAGIIPDDTEPRATLTAIYYEKWFRHNSVNLETLNIVEKLLHEIEVNNTFVQDLEQSNNIRPPKIYGVYDVCYPQIGEAEHPNYFIFSSGLKAIFKKSRCDTEIKKLQAVGIITDKSVSKKRTQFFQNSLAGWHLNYDKLINFIK